MVFPVSFQLVVNFLFPSFQQDGPGRFFLVVYVPISLVPYPPCHRLYPQEWTFTLMSPLWGVHGNSKNSWDWFFSGQDTSVVHVVRPGQSSTFFVDLLLLENSVVLFVLSTRRNTTIQGEEVSINPFVVLCACHGWCLKHPKYIDHTRPTRDSRISRRKIVDKYTYWYPTVSG